MKFSFSVSRAGVLVFMGVMLMAFSTGCSQDEFTTVKSYNNSIVQIQKDMLNKAQEASKVFEEPNVDLSKVMVTLQGIQKDINTSHDQFKKLLVPAGGEELADAFERFFQVEIQGVQNIISGVHQIQNSQNDPNVMKNFSETFKQFGIQENASLRDFYTTQQQVAEKYGQKVIQTDK